MFTLLFSGLQVVSHKGKPRCRFHIELCKFVENISSSIWSLDLKLGEACSPSISYNITCNFLGGFRIIFLLRDNSSQAGVIIRSRLFYFYSLFCFCFSLFLMFFFLESSNKKGLAFCHDRYICHSEAESSKSDESTKYCGLLEVSSKKQIKCSHS